MTPTTERQESDLPKIGQPATRALAHLGYVRLDQVATMSERELLALHGVGPKAVRILREALRERGLSFVPDPEEWPMRKLVVGARVSMDGVMQAPMGPQEGF